MRWERFHFRAIGPAASLSMLPTATERVKTETSRKPALHKLTVLVYGRPEALPVRSQSPLVNYRPGPAGC